MIKLILMLTCLFLMATASAQQQDLNDPRYKKYAGRYGSSSGISLFEDGTYLLYGYATAVFGTYRFENDQLLFSADREELFEVFAHYNPSLAKHIRINFVGFERGGRTFAKLGNDSIKPVFNEDANCFSSPFVYLNPGKMQHFALVVTPPEFSRSNAPSNTFWTYINQTGYNDFIFVHHAAKRENQDFAAMVSTTEKGEVIKLSNYGGEQGYLKQKDDKDNQNWKEILELKKHYDQDKRVKNNIIYANQHYNTFNAPEAASYRYDKKQNLYISRQAKENKIYYMQNQYNDPSYLRQYQRLAPQSKDKFNHDTIKLGKSLFFTVCGEGSELSYHYSGFTEYKISQQQGPVILQPVKIQNQKQ